MPRERDEPVGTEGVGVVAVAAGGAEQFAADILEPAFEPAAIP
jgi:hypothetical protein